MTKNIKVPMHPPSTDYIRKEKLEKKKEEICSKEGM